MMPTLADHEDLIKLNAIKKNHHIKVENVVKQSHFIYNPLHNEFKNLEKNKSVNKSHIHNRSFKI